MNRPIVIRAFPRRITPISIITSGNNTRNINLNFTCRSCTSKIRRIFLCTYANVITNCRRRFRLKLFKFKNVYLFLPRDIPFNLFRTMNLCFFPMNIRRHIICKFYRATCPNRHAFTKDKEHNSRCLRAKVLIFSSMRGACRFIRNTSRRNYHARRRSVPLNKEIATICSSLRRNKPTMIKREKGSNERSNLKRTIKRKKN